MHQQERPASLASLRQEAPIVGFLRAADYHRISRPQAYRFLAAGKLPFPVHKVGDRWRVKTAELAESLGVDPALLLRSDESAA